MTDLHRALEFSTGERPCRFPTPDGTSHCRYCGWPLDYVPPRGEGASYVSGYYRHRGSTRGLGAEYPHQKATELPLSAADEPSGESQAAHPQSTLAAPEGYPHQRDVTFAFRQRAGAGGRLVVPTPAEYAAFKARWAA